MQERQLEILRAIVDEYVATQEPVGSKAIAERHPQEFHRQRSAMRWRSWKMQD